MGLYEGLYKGLLWRLVRGILGVKTMAHTFGILRLGVQGLEVRVQV